MKVHIAIDTKTFVRFWLVVIGFALLFMAIYQARTALILVGISIFLALALNPSVAKLTHLLPWKSRILSTAIAYLAVVVLLGGIIFLVIPPIIQQSVKLVDTLPNVTKSVTEQWKGADSLIKKYHLEKEIDSVVVSLKDSVSSSVGSVSKNIVGSLGSLAGFVASAFLVLVMTFLMLIEGPQWIKRIWSVYKDSDRLESHRKLATKMYDVVNGYVVGQLTVSALDGIFAGLCVFILSLFLDIPANLALPTVAILFIASLIPMFGATIGGILVAILLSFNDFTAAIVFFIYFVLYQQLENNLIAPTIQSKRLELSPLTVLVAVTVGLYVFGLVGGIISIPVAGCAKILLENYLEQRKKQAKKANRPIARLVKKIKSEAETAAEA